MDQNIANRYQRVGAISNAYAGREFEEAARLYFAETGSCAACRTIFSLFAPKSIRCSYRATA